MVLLAFVVRIILSKTDIVTRNSLVVIDGNIFFIPFCPIWNSHKSYMTGNRIIHDCPKLPRLLTFIGNELLALYKTVYNSRWLNTYCILEVWIIFFLNWNCNGFFWQPRLSVTQVCRENGNEKKNSERFNTLKTSFINRRKVYKMIIFSYSWSNRFFFVNMNVILVTCININISYGYLHYYLGRGHI